MKNNTFQNPQVEQKFAVYPTLARKKLLFIRQLIFQTASSIDEVGPISETLKWGEPAYVPVKPKTGSPIRIDYKAKNPHRVDIYFNCKTTLVDTFKEQFGSLFHYEGNRCIYFYLAEDIPIHELSHCFAMALTYHLNSFRF